jgi:hypothetical protein
VTESGGSYRVKIDAEGISIEREVPAQVGRQVVLLVLTGEAGGLALARTPKSASTSEAVPPVGEEATSLREYLDECEASRAPDKITAIGLFLKNHRARVNFERGELDVLFAEAGETVPKNLPRDFRWAVRLGWIAPTPGDAGRYYVTAKGTDVVNKKFPREVVKKTSLGPPRAKKLEKTS